MCYVSSCTLGAIFAPKCCSSFRLLSASSSLASLARASSTSADVTEDTVVAEIPQLSFAMSSDGVPQLSFASYDFCDLSVP